MATLLVYCIVVPKFDIVSVISCFVLLLVVAGHSLADCKHRAERFIGGFRQQGRETTQPDSLLTHAVDESFSSVY